MVRRSMSAVLALLAMTLLLGACVIDTDDSGHSGPRPRDADAVVTIADMSFSPPTVGIKAGETVAWLWDNSSVTHDVVFDGGPASPQQSDGTWEHRFAERGSYDYRCTIHSWMTGTVIVR